MIPATLMSLLLAGMATPTVPATAPATGAKRPPHAAARVEAAQEAATEQPSAQSFVNAIQIYPYREGAIYQALVAPGMVTDIALQPGEMLVAVAAGDTARWVIGDTTSGAGDAKRTHVLVKPHATSLVTNLVVTTDRRTYYLKLTATRATAMAGLSWTYPADALIALKAPVQAAAALPAPTGSGLDIERLNFGYAIGGAKVAWRPLRAFDDGRHTYLEFPASITTGEAPPLFVVGRDGAAELVNYRMRGRFYVVDRIFEAAELRLGTRKQQVVRIERQTALAPSTGDRS